VIANPPIFVDPSIGATFTTSYSANGRSTGGADAIAFRYIADAIRFCSAGSTIHLRGGTYQELATFQANRQCSFWLNKALTLAAYQNETPIWTYSAIPLYDGADYGPIVYAAAAGAVLRGVTIIGTHAAGDSPGGGDLDCNVLIQNGQGVTLDGCTLSGFGHCGAKTLVGDLMISNCTIEDGGFTGRDHCIYISNTGTVVIQESTLQRAAGYGAHLYGTPQGVIIEDCNIADNGQVMESNAGGGILLGGNGGHIIGRNQITNNAGYGGFVLWKSASVGNTITDNVITGNTGNADVVLDDAVAPQTESGNTVGTFWTNTDYAAWPH